MLLLNSPSFSKTKVYVLCYHSFRGNINAPTDFSKKEINEQLDFLKKNNFKFVSFRDIVNNRLSGTKNILITIDDGNISVYDAYRDIFKPMNIKPVLAIYPALTGRKKYALSWGQLKELADDGCEIAAHGYFHMHLTQNYYDTHKNDFLNEIYKSKKVLEKNLNRQVLIFVYPFGQKSEIAIETIKNAGYKYAFTLKWHALNLPLSENKNLYELPRYMLTKPEWKSAFHNVFRDLNH